MKSFVLPSVLSPPDWLTSCQQRVIGHSKKSRIFAPQSIWISMTMDWPWRWWQGDGDDVHWQPHKKPQSSRHVSQYAHYSFYIVKALWSWTVRTMGKELARRHGLIFFWRSGSIAAYRCTITLIDRWWMLPLSFFSLSRKPSSLNVGNMFSKSHFPGYIVLRVKGASFKDE